MRCTSCGTDNREGAKFCDACGTPLPLSCPACGTANRSGAKFCNACGASLTGQWSVPAPAQEVPTPTTPIAQPTQVVSPSVASPTSEAERRQLTVMFCDLVESTQLSTQLDPEDLRDVIQAYQRVCAEVITRFDGYIAQYLGDGLLIYFGYPQAHEDDAHRAVRSGLEILDTVGTLNTRLEQDKGIRLAVRLGIHTGLVVVGAMGGAGRQEQLALGEVPNIAARMQGLAAANTVAISE